MLGAVQCATCRWRPPLQAVLMGIMRNEIQRTSKDWAEMGRRFQQLEEGFNRSNRERCGHQCPACARDNRSSMDIGMSRSEATDSMKTTASLRNCAISQTGIPEFRNL